MEKRRIHTISETSVLTTKFQQTKRTKHEKTQNVCRYLKTQANSMMNFIIYFAMNNDEKQRRMGRKTTKDLYFVHIVACKRRNSFQ